MITEYRTYLSPKKVYIPLTDIDYKLANVSVEIGDKVLIGQKLADKFLGKEKAPILSSISGEVVAFEEKMDRFGKLIDHVVIENDKENNFIKLPIFEDEIATAEVRNALKNAGLLKITVDGLFTDITFNSLSEHVVINAIFTNEPFISTDYESLIHRSKEVVDGIKLLGIAANAKTLTIIVDKFMPAEALKELSNAVGDSNINIVTIDVKKIKGWDYKIIRKLVQHDLSIDLLDDGVIYTNICAAKLAHEIIREGKPLTSKLVAITGDGFKMNAVYNVRIGTLFTDLVNDLDGYEEVDQMNIHIGSFLTGVQMSSDEFAITESIDSINVSEYREVEEDVCIKCGDCNDICPAGILPQNIMDAELRSVNLRIVELNTNLCVECGLCAYVCPSKINVLEWVRRAKRRVG